MKGFNSKQFLTIGGLVLGLAGMLIANKKDDEARKELKDELKEELLEELKNESDN